MKAEEYSRSSTRRCEELKAEGTHVGKKRIVRLLRLAGLYGVSRRRRFRTT